MKSKYGFDGDEDNEYVPVDCFIHKYTGEGGGYLISIEGEEDEAIWVPASQVDDNEEYEEGDFNVLYIKEWIAKKKGLI